MSSLFDYLHDIYKDEVKAAVVSHDQKEESDQMKVWNSMKNEAVEYIRLHYSYFGEEIIKSLKLYSLDDLRRIIYLNRCISIKFVTTEPELGFFINYNLFNYKNESVLYAAFSEVFPELGIIHIFPTKEESEKIYLVLKFTINRSAIESNPNIRELFRITNT